MDSSKRTEPGRVVNCPSCKVRAAELLCSSCVTGMIKKEKDIHDAQREARDKVKIEAQDFLQNNMDSATLAFETNFIESENETLRQLVEETRVTLARLRDTRKEWGDKLEKRKKDLAAAKERMMKAIAYDEDIVDPLVSSMELAADNLEMSVASERRKKMEQLHEIFPLEPSGGPVSTIAGVPLDLQHDNPQTSLSLVLIGRVTMLGAHYLRIPLPFHLLYEKGEAKIANVRNDPSTLTAIYRKLPALQTNIRTLCIAQGVPPNVITKDYIDNLWQLFHSPSLGKSIRDGMKEAEERDNKLLLRRAESTNASSTANSTSSRKGQSKRSQKQQQDDDFVLVN